MNNKLRDVARSALNGPVDEKVIDETIYGSLGELSAGKMVARPVALVEIAPDPRQPRRQIPNAVRAGWDGQNTGVLFDRWIEAAAAERGTDYARMQALLEMVLRGEATHPDAAYDEHPSPTPPLTPLPERTKVLSPGLRPQQGGEKPAGYIEAKLFALAGLAENIHISGKLNYPIRVAPGVANYQIIMGERRWLAFNLLHLVFGEAYAKIPAFIEPVMDVWAQAAENNQREDLDAIEKARQFAVLLMDVLSADIQFLSFDEAVPAGGCDRAYYAQVADGNAYRVPRMGGERIANAMGVKNPVQLRQYRALLRLPDAVWEAANDLGWSENLLREMMSRAVNDQHLTDLARIEAAKAGYTVTAVTVWEDNPHPLAPSPLHGEGGQVLGERTGEGLPEEVWAQYDTPVAGGVYPAPTVGAGESARVWSAYEVEKLLKWAWRWAQGHLDGNGGGWFSAQDVALSDTELQAFWDTGLLEMRHENKGRRIIVQYRITPAGCKRIGHEVLYGRQVPQPGASGRPVPKVRPKPLLSSQEAQLFDSLAALTDSGVRGFDAEAREKAMQLVSRCMDILKRVGREIAGGGEEY